MARRLLVLSGVALVLLMLSAVSNPADARRGGYGSGGARGHVGGRVHVGPRTHFRARPHVGPRMHFRARPHLRRHFTHRRHFRDRRVHRRPFIGAPFVYGGYSYYGDDCYWLRRRALATGSAYWWDRYYDCIDDYED